MSHFLFVAGALRERSSLDSAELQLSHQVWGLRSGLIRANLQQYLTDQSSGLVYALKVGLCAQFRIVSQVLPLASLDELTHDELRSETRYGFVRIDAIVRWESGTEQSLALLQGILKIADREELTRRLNLGMHRLTEDEYEAIIKRLT
ncbi:MAG: hypothetical protein ACE5NA_07630 [Nitrospiraceae bacterium]